MSRRILGSLLVLALAAGVAGCGDDDGDGSASATTTQPGASEESQETANFCRELVEFGTQASNFNFSTPEAMAEWSEEVGTQARELAAAAPGEIKDVVEEFAANAQRRTTEIAEGNTEAANEANTRLTEALTRMTTFAQDNCQGASIPTTAPGTGG